MITNYRSVLFQEEEEVAKFISKGGKLAIETDDQKVNSNDYRLTKLLMDKVDSKRKDRVGKVSRNLWILEVIEKAAQ